ncbi:MAG TPA: helicase RepA family protein [Smithellaceae bacterium]|nr:helicase RepA family protein [Smithellaceae bacterium]
MIAQPLSAEQLDEFEKMNGGARTSDQGKQKAETKNHFHFIAADELCNKPSSATWLIKPYFDKGTPSMIFGDAGSGKSFMGVDIGLCVATKMPWHGYEVNEPGTVFYIAGEGFSGLNRRVKAHSDSYGYDLAGIPFYISDRPARILDRDSIKEVENAIDSLIADHGEPALIIIDTLNRNFGPGDENSTADMTRFISGFDEIRARYHCAILIIHHSGLSATERARGASALRAALDWEYRLTKNTDGTRTLTCTKAKDHSEPEPLSFELKPVDLDWLDENGEPMTSCILQRVDLSTTDKSISLRGTKRIAYDCLIKLGGNGVDVDEWRLACYEAGISPTSNTEAKRKAFKRAVSELRDHGIVSARNDLWWSKQADTGQMKDYNDLQDRY